MNPLEAFSHIVTRLGRFKRGGDGEMSIPREGESKGRVLAVGSGKLVGRPLWLRGLKCPAAELGFCNVDDGDPSAVLGEKVT